MYFNFLFNVKCFQWMNSRALILLTTEELSELSEVLPFVAFLVLTFFVSSPDTSVEIFLQPVWVWERQIGECSLPLYKVPRSPDVVVPGDDSLHWVPHHVDVYWHVKIKPREEIIIAVNINIMVC